MLEEVLTWLGVAAAAAVAWGLYIFGENQGAQSGAKVEETTSED